MQTRWVGLQVERNSAHDLVCITSICHAEQLYIDTAFMLAASTRVEAAARSDAIATRCRSDLQGGNSATLEVSTIVPNLIYLFWTIDPEAVLNKYPFCARVCDEICPPPRLPWKLSSAFAASSSSSSFAFAAGLCKGPLLQLLRRDHPGYPASSRLAGQPCCGRRYGHPCGCMS